MIRKGKDTTTTRRSFGTRTVEHSRARLKFNCPCGRHLGFRSGQEKVTCKKCGTAHTRPLHLVKVKPGVV